MSDKHTDAQGELTAADAIHILRLALVNAEYAIKGREHTGFITKALEATSRDWRATEGQAQTSAARHDRSPYIFGVKPPVSVTAQLADSTAPGAAVVAEIGDPLMLSEHAFTSPLCYRLYKSEIASYQLAMKSAAPTAQQSLTAGGAVPDALRPFAKIADLYDEREDDHFQIWKDCHEKSTHITLGECRAARAALVAAPLPQVQSEALDTIRPQPNHPGRWLRGNDGISYPSKHAAQQHVTQSGALADNDGGVK